MAIEFPSSPSTNDTFTAGSITYKWDGAKWIGLGVTPADRLVEGSNKLEIDGSNQLVWTGSTAKFGGVLQGDQRVIINGAGGKSGTSNTLLNYAGDGSTVTAALTADGFLVAAAGHFTANVTPTSGRGVEIFEASAGVGQISSFNRTGSSWDELRIKGSEVKIYTGTSNGLSLDLAAVQSTLYGTSDGILNLDTTNGGGSFMRFKQSGTTKCWVGSAEQMGGGTGADQDDLGLRATGNIILRANGAERLRVHEDGYVTTPSQPSFQCVKNGNFTFTANTESILTPWTEKHDTGSDFNNTTGIFTAPVAGKYFFYVSAMAQRQDNGDYQVRIYKNGTQYVGSNDMNDSATTTFQQTTVNGIVDLAANDEVTFVVRNGSGTSTFIYQTPYTHCGGYLIG